MTTRAELVQLTPAVTAGLPMQMEEGVGIWRWAVEIADPLFGADIEWLDVTCDVLGSAFTRGAGEYRGVAQASTGDVELRAEGDQYAPWNEDTSPTFGEHVELGPGLLIRLSYFRVSGGAVVEWRPRFTMRIEQWLDVTGGMGEIRRHPIVCRDLSTELVNVPLPAVATVESWYDRVLRIVTESGWPYGVEIFGAVDYESVPIIELPARPEAPSAIAELDATLAPAGLTWYTSRRGVLTIRPVVGDLFHSDYLDAGASGFGWVDHPERKFSYFADTDGGISYVVGPNDVGPFGIDKTELQIINHVVVNSANNLEITAEVFGGDPVPADLATLASDGTYGDGVYAGPAFDSIGVIGSKESEYVVLGDGSRAAYDAVGAEWVVVTPTSTAPFDDEDAVSVDRFGRKTRQMSWLVANDPVATRIVTTRAYATRQARPIMAQLGRIGFETGGTLDLDYLSPASVRHTTKLGREVVTGVGNVRSIVERIRPRSPESIWLDVISILDLTSTSVASSMLPVEALAVSGITEDAATFSWTNPTQTATPNTTQIRIPQLSNLWIDAAYPITGLTWGGLAPNTAYTFQVRLVELVDGNIVDSSATRQVGFVTLAATVPVVGGGDGGDVDVDVPDPDEGCDVEWELQQSEDVVTWTTIESGENPPGGEVVLDAELFEPGYTYRVRSREVCDDVPGDWLVSDVFLPDCTISGAYNTGDYADPTLMLFVPEICTPDVVRDAVSGDPAIKGPAWGEVQSIDTDTLALASSTSAGGVVAYGDASGLQDQYGDATLGALVSIQVQETQRFASIPGLRLDAVPEGSGWKARAGVTTVLGDEVTIESGELPLITPADVRTTYDSTTGVLTLYVDGVEEATDAVEEAAERANAGAYWYTALPPASWVTNIAAWASVMAIEPPLPPGPPTGMDLWLDASNTSTITAPGSDVTQINDLSGNAQHSTNVSGTIKSGTTTQNSLNVLDFQPGFIYRTNFSTSLWSNRAMTLAIVARVDNPSTNQALFSIPHIVNEDHQTFIMKVGSGSLIFDYGNGSAFSSGSSLRSATFGITPNTSGFHLWVVQIDTSAISLRQDSSNITLTSTANSMPQSNWLVASPPATTQWRLCARQHSTGTYAIDGIVGEALLYPSILAGSDLTDLEAYLMDKWDI
jgi:hypothetical protein